MTPQELKAAKAYLIEIRNNPHLTMWIDVGHIKTALSCIERMEELEEEIAELKKLKEGFRCPPDCTGTKSKTHKEAR